MSTKHTPGPWTLNTQYADIEVRGPEESGVLIAVMSPWGIAAEGPNPQVANARLIAAAPDLLAALRTAESALRSFQYGNASEGFARNMADVCGAAISKATGGET